MFFLGHLSYSFLPILIWPWVTNIRGRGCLYEGDSLKNHYPRGGALIRGGGRHSIKKLLSREGAFIRGGGGIIREGALFRGNTVYTRNVKISAFAKLNTPRYIYNFSLDDFLEKLRKCVVVYIAQLTINWDLLFLNLKLSESFGLEQFLFRNNSSQLTVQILLTTIQLLLLNIDSVAFFVLTAFFFSISFNVGIICCLPIIETSLFIFLL